MKLIALHNFLNTHELEVSTDGEKTTHEKLIPKGAIIYIGEKLEFAKLKASDKELVALLNHAHCIGDANDEKLVKRIQNEVAQEKKVEARQASTAVMAGSTADVIAQLVASGVLVVAKQPAAAAAK